MLERIVSSPVLLALIAALFYGLGGPVMKSAGIAGATPSGLAFMYALGAAVVAVNWTGQTTLFSSSKAAILALLMGLMFGLAFRALAHAFTLPTGYLSIVLVISASYPLVSSVCGLIFFDEASRMILPRIILGSLFVVGGVYLVGTSLK